MSFLKKISMVALMLWIAVLGFWFGTKMAFPSARSVETSRMEKCLQLYKQYRIDNDQKRLSSALAELSLTPCNFQEIIDRFIYYRSRKSSMKQAMNLLKAFRLGYDIEVEDVFHVSGLASEPFMLDAEILAVFESSPDLIREAFES